MLPAQAQRLPLLSLPAELLILVLMKLQELCDLAHTDCVCGLPRTRVVLRAEASGRLVAGFPGGGELFAIASTGRMPLERTAFELVPADDGSPWFSLRHGAQHVVVLPAGAPRGRGMVLLVPP